MTLRQCQGIESTATGSRISVDEARVQRDSAIPLRRQATAREVADAMLFLASPASSYITEACLDITAASFSGEQSREELLGGRKSKKSQHE